MAQGDALNEEINRKIVEAGYTLSLIERLIKKWLENERKSPIPPVIDLRNKKTSL